MKKGEGVPPRAAADLGLRRDSRPGEYREKGKKSPTQRPEKEDLPYAVAFLTTGCIEPSKGIASRRSQKGVEKIESASIKKNDTSGLPLRDPSEVRTCSERPFAGGGGKGEKKKVRAGEEKKTPHKIELERQKSIETDH